MLATLRRRFGIREAMFVFVHVDGSESCWTARRQRNHPVREDDDFLRPSVCNTLSRLGYHVIPVNNGIKALEIWQVRREDIQMLITDLVMPGGITRKQLAERLLKQNPKLKVLYPSGYSAEIAGTDVPLKGKD